MGIKEALAAVKQITERKMMRYIEYDDCFLFSAYPVGTKTYGEYWFAVDKENKVAYFSEPREQKNTVLPIPQNYL